MSYGAVLGRISKLGGVLNSYCRGRFNGELSFGFWRAKKGWEPKKPDLGDYALIYNHQIYVIQTIIGRFSKVGGVLNSYRRGCFNGLVHFGFWRSKNFCEPKNSILGTKVLKKKRFKTSTAANFPIDSLLCSKSFLSGPILGVRFKTLCLLDLKVQIFGPCSNLSVGLELG